MTKRIMSKSNKAKLALIEGMSKHIRDALGIASPDSTGKIRLTRFSAAADMLPDTARKEINIHIDAMNGATKELYKQLGMKLPKGALIPKLKLLRREMRLHFANKVLADAEADCPYVSFRWDEDLTTAGFALKLARFADCTAGFNSADEIVSLTFPNSSKPVKITPGQWIVFGENKTVVGVYSDEEHEAEYEIVFDWR